MILERRTKKGLVVKTFLLSDGSVRFLIEQPGRDGLPTRVVADFDLELQDLLATTSRGLAAQFGVVMAPVLRVEPLTGGVRLVLHCQTSIDLPADPGIKEGDLVLISHAESSMFALIAWREGEGVPIVSLRVPPESIRFGN
ncbi:MAG TPA: hypothetical protein PK263_02400 [bacterium]|nr:hypothetical protein [bacterium]